MTQDYLLGADERELARLGFQHEVWAPTTRAFLDRIGVAAGMRVLDLGSGPGFVTLELAGRVGPTGHVTALDLSERSLASLERAARERGLAHVAVACTRLAEARFPLASFDVVFARWFWSFVPEIESAVQNVATWLAPGGVLALQDYNHEGISVFPRSAGFTAAIRATRASYLAAGGDMFVAGRVLALFRAAGLELVDLKSNVLCGGPESMPFRWADGFFPNYSAQLERDGHLTASDRAQFLAEWEERKCDPTSMFFSPIVLDAAARRPRSR